MASKASRGVERDTDRGRAEPDGQDLYDLIMRNGGEPEAYAKEKPRCVRLVS